MTKFLIYIVAIAILVLLGVDTFFVATGKYTAISGEDLKSKSIVIRSEAALENGQRVRLEDYGAK